MTLIIVALIAVAFLIVAFALLFARMASRLDKPASIAEWFQSFSVDDFSPMERLLDRSDFEFLSRQPGYRPEIGIHLLLRIG